MVQYDYIRTAYRVYGKSLREIARETGHSRNTIRKALENEYPDKRCRPQQQKYPVLEPYLQFIEHWLEQDKTAPKKQRHTARRIFNRLVHEHQFQGSESAVKKYVKEAKLRLGLNCPQVFIPLNPEVGKAAEVDWGCAYAILCEEKVQLKYFCMRSKYSGKQFLRFYEVERQQAFFDAHLQAFEFFGGIFPTLIYDNLKTAVQTVLVGKKRIEQESFKKFKAYYSFSAQFCNPGEGHEKGGVEGMVGFVRRNYMVPIPQACSLEDLNKKMLEECVSYGSRRVGNQEKTVNEKFEEERGSLLEIPQIPFSNVNVQSAKVDKYSTVIVEQNRYSAPTRYARVRVQVLVYVGRVEIWYENKRLAKHQRSFKKGEWILEPLHYLELIRQRPGSFEEARPMQQWKEVWPKSMTELLKKFCESHGEKKGVKEFLEVLMLFKEYKEEEVESAIELALENKISCWQGVKQILVYSTELEERKEPLKNWEVIEPPSLEGYAELGKTP
jgi:transposase